MSFALAFVPRRIRGVELFDDPRADTALSLRSLADVARANRLFGGTSAVLAELRPLFRSARERRSPLTLLDVGTGAGDIPESARREAARTGVVLETIGLEHTAPLATASRLRTGLAVAGDALALPFASRSVDIVTCSQVLHHFTGNEARTLICELHRVARLAVIVAELRRAWAAAAGLWLASWMLGFHPVSRHDGVVSVLRGYRAAELLEAVHRSTSRRATVHNRRGFRVTASWRPE